MALFLFPSSSVFHLPFCCLWYVSGDSNKPVMYVRAWCRAIVLLPGSRRGRRGCAAQWQLHPYSSPLPQSKDSEQDEWWGDFSPRFPCKSILSHLFIQNLVWAENETEGGRSSIFAEEMYHSRNQTFFWHFIMDKEPCRSEVPGPWFDRWDVTLADWLPSAQSIVRASRTETPQPSQLVLRVGDVKGAKLGNSH